MRAVIYVLKGGLKHYEPPGEGERAFYWDPESRALYPPSLSGFDEYVVVDSNIVTGRTVMEAIRLLGLPRERVRVRGSPLTEVARRIVDEPLPERPPDPERVLIAVAGKAASLKSFLARGLEAVHGIPVVQVGRELRRLVDVGAYGEALGEAERLNPFIVGELLYPIVAGRAEKAVILDGVKRFEAALLLSYATRRPLFIFYVESPNEQLRRRCIELRMDSDDAYADQRDELFRAGLEELRRRAYAVIDMSDWRTMQPLCSLLNALGFKTGTLAGMPNPFGSKRPILELYRRSVEKLAARGAAVAEDLSAYVAHRSYPERLRRLGIILDGRLEEAVNLVASAFRIIDDILDENTVRDYRPALWVERGFVEAVYAAVAMTVKAYAACAEAGAGAEFMSMFRRVVEAVNYELLVEDGLAEFRGFQDWLRAAEREAAFREFLAVLAGRPDKREEFRMWGLRAQAKDDLLGAGKGGREETEGRLRRPLFKPEWASLIGLQPAP